jgi:hypothetical protein
MRCRVNVFNCHPDNDIGNLVTEPLSSNGRPIRFRYSGFQWHATITLTLTLAFSVFSVQISTAIIEIGVFCVIVQGCYMQDSWADTKISICHPPPPLREHEIRFNRGPVIASNKCDSIQHLRYSVTVS